MPVRSKASKPSAASAPAPDTLPLHRLRRLDSPPIVAILGAGPAGLEAALYARRLGLKTLLFERDALVAPEVRWWAHISMFTPWGDNRTPLGELALREQARGRFPMPQARLYPTGADFLARYLEPLAFSLGDTLHTDTRVVAVGRSFMFPQEHESEPDVRRSRRFRLLTRTPRDERIFTADYVLDTTGVTHTPRWMGSGGLPALGEMGSRGQVFTHIPDIAGRDRIHFLGKRTLLVGDGPSAATCAVALGQLLDKDPPASLVWVAKTRELLPLPITPRDPLPRRDLLLKKANLLALGSHPRLEYLPTTQVEAVQHSLADNRFTVTLQVDHVTRRLKVDSVISAVGSRTDTHTFERALHQSEPGWFVLGSKAGACAGQDFALSHLRTQIRDTFQQICADPDLDLYAQAAQALAAQARLAADPQYA